MVRATVCLYFCLLLFLLVVLLNPVKLRMYRGWAGGSAHHSYPGIRADGSSTGPHASRLAELGKRKHVELLAGFKKIIIGFCNLK